MRLFKNSIIFILLITSFTLLISCEDKNTVPEKSILHLIYPEDGANSIDLNSVLKWECKDAIYFSIYVGNNELTDELFAYKIESDSIDLHRLDYDKLYFWKIVAYYSMEDSIISEIRSFKTLKLLPLKLKNIDINIPKINMQLSVYTHWNYYFDFYQRRDTIVKNEYIIRNTNDIVNRMTNFRSYGSHLYFDIYGREDYEYKSIRDTLKGILEIDTINKILNLNINCYNKEYYYREAYWWSKEITSSEISFKNVPYLLTQSSTIESEIDIDMISNYEYNVYQNEVRDAEFGGSEDNCLSINNFENDNVGKIIIYLK